MYPQIIYVAFWLVRSSGCWPQQSWGEIAAASLMAIVLDLPSIPWVQPMVGLSGNFLMKSQSVNPPTFLAFPHTSFF